jgi:hypothetical protein
MLLDASNGECRLHPPLVVRRGNGAADTVLLVPARTVGPPPVAARFDLVVDRTLIILTGGTAPDIVETPCLRGTGPRTFPQMGDNATPPAVPGDSKDWTWVLTQPCPECGVEPGAIEVADVPAMVRSNAAGWRRVLGRVDVRQRPQPDVWSPLEYGCHVRDVFRLFDARLASMLDEHDPQFANWDQDETAGTDRYHDQDPAAVADELAVAADRIAASFAAVRSDQLDRPGRRSDGAVFTVRTFAQYFVHDPVHHLWDVGG